MKKYEKLNIIYCLSLMSSPIDNLLFNILCDILILIDLIDGDKCEYILGCLYLLLQVHIVF